MSQGKVRKIGSAVDLIRVSRLKPGFVVRAARDITQLLVQNAGPDVQPDPL